MAETPAFRRRWFLTMLVLTLVILAGMRWTDGHLKNPVAPGGIVSLELAGSTEAATKIIESWRGNELYAGFSMGLDFLFLVAYSVTLALALWSMARRMPTGSRLRQFAVYLGYAQFVAAGLDIIENLAMIVMLSGEIGSVAPVIARVCAIPKFIIVLTGLVTAVVAAVRNLKRP